ncbi:MAG: heme exporter protein CcmD [Alphaproteobacteria bacterium]|jgi:heme exporter protein D|nr:heme exporter protein CcmD [Alphaproteobacteria bacterium]
MTDFLNMGGYALYVWGAYGVCALVMIGLLAASLRRLKAREAALRQLQPEKRRARRDGHAEDTPMEETGGHAA